ncbi:MAG: T9SS type A sorting domain-containing protein, partial [Bacteroidales bacterium]|nr:T9SS type A sorting domain-containing protein [Bacteroidales bacterium]
GEIVNSLVQNLDGNPYYLWPVGADKYHMWSWENSVVQLNADLSYDTTYPINLSSEFFIWRTQPYNDQSYFLLGDRPGGSPGINDVEIAVVHVDNEANVLNSFVFGFVGEWTSGACLSSIDPGVLFIGGTASEVDYTLIDSTDFNQIFIHKTNISGEIQRTSFYSTNGSIRMGNLLATSDGGCLISGEYNDFMNHPFTHISDAFFLKMDANGIITSLPFNKTSLKPTAYAIHPNPVKEKFRIQSATGQTTKAMLYNLNGALVKRFEFVSDFEADVSTLMPGAYLLQLSRQDGYMESRKLIIMNR